MALTKRHRPTDLVGTIGGFPFFKGVRKSDVEALAALALCHDYPKNNILSYRGDPAGSIFLVLAGRMKVILTNDEGREVILSILAPGGLFGITAAFDDGVQPAQAVTLERSKIARFNAGSFVRWTEASAGARGALVRELTRQVRELTHKIGEHALMSTRDRLLSTLLEIADEEGEPEPGGTQVAFKRPTHRELANRIGTSREVVSRLLAELRDTDAFEADEGRVIRVPMSALVLRDEGSGA